MLRYVKITALLLTALAVTASIIVFSISSFAEEDPSIVLLVDSSLAFDDGKVVSIDAAPLVIRGRTFVPIRVLAERLGAEMVWEEQSETVQLTYDETVVQFTLNDHEAYIQGETVWLFDAPLKRYGRIYVPLQPVTDAFELRLYYDRGLIVINTEFSLDKLDAIRETLEQGYPYSVIHNNELAAKYATKREAIARSEELLFSWVEDEAGNIVSKHFPPYEVSVNGNPIGFFNDFAKARERGVEAGNADIFYHGELVWSGSFSLPERARIRGVPLIGQFPELARGCEVTSLAMLLEYHGIDADKLDLAKEVKTLPYEQNGLKSNPFEGFVGNIYTFKEPGLSAYHGPIAELGKAYAGDRIADLTGASFEEILFQLSLGRPVWVITPSTYDVVPEHLWETWQTESGEVRVTFRQHSVVLIGYDEHYVYVNDPLLRTTKVDRERFRKGWEQLYSQAITMF